MKRKGAPPKSLTGQVSVKSIDSPWWDSIAVHLSSNFLGQTMSVEELASKIPPYPTGSRVKTRTVARRLKKILQLVERGPNRSLGNGATYKVLPLVSPQVEGEVEITSDDDWLEQQIRRMTCEDD